MTYATEADIINVALFGCTAKEWRDAHPEEKGTIRDWRMSCSSSFWRIWKR